RAGGALAGRGGREPPPAQISGEGERRPGGPLPAAVQCPAVEGDGLVEAWVAIEERLVGAVDDPGDVGVGELVPQRPEDGQSVDDVPEGARLDDRDAASPQVGERGSVALHKQMNPPRRASRPVGSVFTFRTVGPRGPRRTWRVPPRRVPRSGWQ